jgi:hypothetical protein
MVDALRERAVVSLWHQLFSERLDMRHQDRSSPQARRERERRAAVFGGHVAALHAVEAVTEAEACTWMSRFEAEAAAGAAKPGQPPEAGIPDGARRLLEALLDDSARGRGSGWMRRDLSAYERALMALLDCRAISHEEYSRWLDRFLAHPELPAEALEVRRQTMLSRQRCSGVDLQRVVTAPPNALGDLRIRYAELYADGVRVLWTRPVRAPVGNADRDRKPKRPLPELRDDLDTRYWGHADSERYGGRHVAFEQGVYVPAIEPDATSLRISHQGAVVTLALAP